MFEAAKFWPVSPISHEIGICDENSGRPFVGLENPDRLSRLDEQSLIIFKFGERAHDGIKGGPVPSRLACTPIDDQFLWVFSNGGIQIVVEHSDRSLLAPTLCAHLTACCGMQNSVGLGLIAHVLRIPALSSKLHPCP